MSTNEGCEWCKDLDTFKAVVLERCRVSPESKVTALARLDALREAHMEADHDASPRKHHDPTSTARAGTMPST